MAFVKGLLGVTIGAAAGFGYHVLMNRCGST